jgi:hypothetical protein
MFANIAAQIVGYYLLAAILVPLGYGHLRMRRWARPLALGYLWSWLAVGAPLIVVVAIILLASKNLPMPAMVLALLLLAISYLVLPVISIRFYQGRNVTLTFAAGADESCWLERLPVAILVLSSLYSFFAIMLHILVLLNGMFPLFGEFAFGLQGIALLDLSIGCLILLVLGTLHRRAWAWWGAVVWFSLFTTSTIMTFLANDYASILMGLGFPSTEMEILGNIPAQGYHFAVLVGLPLLMTLIIIVRSKRHFIGRGRPLRGLA